MKKKRNKRNNFQIDKSWELKSSKFFNETTKGLNDKQFMAFDQKAKETIDGIYDHFFEQDKPWDIGLDIYQGDLAWSVIPKYDWYLASKIIDMGLVIKVVDNQFLIHKPTKEEEKCISKQIEFKKKYLKS